MFCSGERAGRMHGLAGHRFPDCWMICGLLPINQRRICMMVKRKKGRSPSDFPRLFSLPKQADTSLFLGPLCNRFPDCGLLPINQRQVCVMEMQKTSRNPPDFPRKERTLPQTTVSVALALFSSAAAPVITAYNRADYPRSSPHQLRGLSPVITHISRYGGPDLLHITPDVVAPYRIMDRRNEEKHR
jgi:hypothetical protein